MRECVVSDERRGFGALYAWFLGVLYDTFVVRWFCAQWILNGLVSLEFLLFLESFLLCISLLAALVVMTRS